MATIVVVGSGVGGFPAALELRKAVRKEDDVVVVSSSPVFQFTPSNPWVAVGWRSGPAISVPLDRTFRKRGIDFVVDSVTKVNPKDKRLELASGKALGYDYLVIATGPRLAFDEIPGFGPEGHTSSICFTPHAEETYGQWKAFLDKPGPILVGAVQGASCFGPAYEYALILDTELRRRKMRDKVPITLLTSEPYIGHLGLGGVEDSKGLLEGLLRDRTIKFQTNTKMDKFEAGGTSWTEVGSDGSELKKGETPFSLGMMIPAFTGVDAVRGVEGLANPRGFILANEFMQNPTYPEVYSVGVCVAIPPYEKTPIPVGVPKTGLMMESMGVAAAHNIRAQLDGKVPHAKPALNALCIADAGDGGLGFIAQPQIPPRNRTVVKTGYSMHLAKLIFEKYYLGKIKRGVTSPFYEKAGLGLMGFRELKKE